MIEVEKKFVLNPEISKSAVAGLEFLGEENISDTYYDTPEYKLLSEDAWLRLRNGSFELKVFQPQQMDRVMDTYEELDKPEEIRSRLNLPPGNLEEAVKQAGYIPLCICKTTRRKYKKDEFSVVLDKAEFEDGFSCDIGEIELMVSYSKDINAAMDRIKEFAEARGLSETPKHGKIVQYLELRIPQAYRAFENRKIKTYA